MLLVTRHNYTLESWEIERDLDVPFVAEIEDGVEAEVSLDDGELAVVLRMSVPLAAVRHASRAEGWVEKPGGTGGLTLLVVEGAAEQMRERLGLVGDLLTFMLGRELRQGRPGGWTQFVAETDEEAAFLASTSSPRLHGDISSGGLLTRSIRPPVCEQNMRFLFDRAVAVRLYGDAIRAHSATSAVRDLWRVLESAFQRRDDALVALLVEYRDAQLMGFDRGELDSLKVLRGRASHAQSRAGLAELRRVDRECEEKRQRLSHLVERVIVTKVTWGAPTTSATELPLRQYTARDGSLVIHMSRQSTDDAT